MNYQGSLLTMIYKQNAILCVANTFHLLCSCRRGIVDASNQSSGANFATAIFTAASWNATCKEIPPLSPLASMELQGRSMYGGGGGKDPSVRPNPLTLYVHSRASNGLTLKIQNRATVSFKTKLRWWALYVSVLRTMISEVQIKPPR